MATPCGHMPFALEATAQVLMVVNFPVQHQDVPAVQRHHGLMPRLGQVKYGQPYVAQGDLRGLILPVALAVGAPMPHALAALTNGHPLIRHRAPGRENSTHFYRLYAIFSVRRSGT